MCVIDHVSVFCYVALHKAHEHSARVARKEQNYMHVDNLDRLEMTGPIPPFPVRLKALSLSTSNDLLVKHGGWTQTGAEETMLWD